MDTFIEPYCTRNQFLLAQRGAEFLLNWIHVVRMKIYFNASQQRCRSCLLNTHEPQSRQKNPEEIVSYACLSTCSWMSELILTGGWMGWKRARKWDGVSQMRWRKRTRSSGWLLSLFSLSLQPRYTTSSPNTQSLISPKLPHSSTLTIGPEGYLTTDKRCYQHDFHQ